jgi:glycosyltransferase involved in cell wall biosynthesis
MASSSTKRKQSVDILFLSHVGYFTGGAERSLVELLQDCADKGFRVHTLLPEKKALAKILKEKGLPFSFIKQAWWTLPAEKQQRVFSAEAIEECVQIIRKLQPKVCVTNTLVAPSLALASSITQTPHIWILREYGESDHGLKFRLGTENTYRNVSALSDTLFCNSLSLRNFYERVLARNDIKVIYPYVSPPVKNSAGGPSVRNSKKQVSAVIVGNVQPSKGQSTAIDAIARLKKDGYRVKLNIVGGLSNAEYHSLLVKKIRQLGLSASVKFHGHLNNPFTIVDDSDIALVCSSSEAFGRVTIEYMYAGVPVIGLNSGGTADIINDGETGLLFEAGGSKLAEKIEQLINDPALASQLAKNAKEKVLPRYSKENNHRQFFEALNPYLVGKGRSSLDISVFGDILELHNDRKVWWKGERQDLEHELTDAHKLIAALTRENSLLKESLPKKVLRKMLKK